MPTPTGAPDAFPFSAEGTTPVPAPRTETPIGLPEAATNLNTTGDVQGATNQRRSVLEQFFRNREGQPGASGKIGRLLSIADRIKALAVDPNSPEGRAQNSQSRGLGIISSILNIVAAVQGRPAQSVDSFLNSGASRSPRAPDDTQTPPPRTTPV